MNDEEAEQVRLHVEAIERELLKLTLFVDGTRPKGTTRYYSCSEPGCEALGFRSLSELGDHRAATHDWNREPTEAERAELALLEGEPG